MFQVSTKVSPRGTLSNPSTGSYNGLLPVLLDSEAAEVHTVFLSGIQSDLLGFFA